jgi:hypothetical protein
MGLRAERMAPPLAVLAPGAQPPNYGLVAGEKSWSRSSMRSIEIRTFCAQEIPGDDALHGLRSFAHAPPRHDLGRQVVAAIHVLAAGRLVFFRPNRRFSTQAMRPQRRASTHTPCPAGFRFLQCSLRLRHWDRVSLRSQGCMSPLRAQTRSACVVPFVRFAPGARGEIVESIGVSPISPPCLLVNRLGSAECSFP